MPDLARSVNRVPLRLTDNWPMAIAELASSGFSVFGDEVFTSTDLNRRSGEVLPEPADQYVPARRRANGIVSLKLTEEAVLQALKLPPVHNDPFDRMLVCQAIVHGLTILTPDKRIARYPVPVVW